MSKRLRHYFILVIVLVVPVIAGAQAMTGTNYNIETDSINIGGIDDSSSASYKLGETLGEVGTGDSGSLSYNLRAGYRQMTGSYISISQENDATLPDVNGLTGGTSDGSLGWTVTTDNAAGYAMTIQAGTNPALKSVLASFADYTPAGDPDYTFSIPTTASEFGFSPEGVDIAQAYLDDGLGSCDVLGGNNNTNTCWDGFSTTPKTIAERAIGNHPSGTLTTVKLRAEVGSTAIKESGTYSVTLSVTAVTL
jgi:hypothetical protein